jgi:hypothetical protein
MVCPIRGGSMRVIAILTDYQAIDWIIAYMKLIFYGGEAFAVPCLRTGRAHGGRGEQTPDERFREKVRLSV